MGREALPEALTAITERPIGHWRAEVRSPAWRGELTFVDAYRRESRFGVRQAPAQVRWKVEVDFARKTTRERTALLTVESPAHGVEKLNEVGLWPWAPGDANAPRWWCGACDGEGWSGFRDNYTCEKCDSLEDGTPLGCVSVPPSLAALVAVASRGPETLRRVAELVRELHAVTRGETGAALVWRVMTREALRKHHERTRANACVGRAEFLCATFSACVLGGEWAEGEDMYGTDHRPLHALADCGVHLVSASPERVVIAIEAL